MIACLFHQILDYWGPSKRLLGELSFLRDLKEYDIDSIPVSALLLLLQTVLCSTHPPQVHVMKKIRGEYASNPEFDPAKVKNASSAAEGLCKWVLAMEIYDRVAKV